MTYASFNQDCTRVCVGLRHGYRTFCIEPFRMVYEKNCDDGASIFEILFSSSLVVHVPAGEGPTSSQRIVRIFHTKRNKEITRMTYSSTVLAVKMNRKTLVVVIETAIYIYDITNMHLLHTIGPTPPNPAGICSLAPCYVVGDPRGTGTLNYFAYPGNAASGEVFVYDVSNMRHVTTIAAHTSAISALTFNYAGTMLATASQKGTVFRVFDSADGTRLFELRRGLKTYASISSLSFNFDSTFLCATSEKSTIHIFKLDQSAATGPAPAAAAAAQPAPAAASSWSSYLASTASLAASYLPASVTDVFSQARSFAQISMPSDVSGVQVLGALWGTADSCGVILVTSQGYLIRYSIDTEKGGECTEIARHSLLAAYVRDTTEDHAPDAPGE